MAQREVDEKILNARVMKEVEMEKTRMQFAQKEANMEQRRTQLQ